MNPKKTNLCDLGDNLSRPGLKLCKKHVDPKTLGGKEWRGSCGNKIERGILSSKTEDDMQIMR